MAVCLRPWLTLKGAAAYFCCCCYCHSAQSVHRGILLSFWPKGIRACQPASPAAVCFLPFQVCRLYVPRTYSIDNFKPFKYTLVIVKYFCVSGAHSNLQFFGCLWGHMFYLVIYGKSVSANQTAESQSIWYVHCVVASSFCIGPKRSKNQGFCKKKKEILAFSVHFSVHPPKAIRIFKAKTCSVSVQFLAILTTSSLIWFPPFTIP